MTNKNKFGFAPVDDVPARKRGDRVPGPMGVAVRDAAESLTETTEVKVAKRRQNAEDAKAYRAAQEEGRVLVQLPVGNLLTDDLPRDRLDLDGVASSDEMEELKASIRSRGQKEPIEVYQDQEGRYQLKKGWRRLNALRQLYDETGDTAFAHVVARIEQGDVEHVARYIDMVEENVVREDLTFAEMAQVAISAAQDERVGEPDPAAMVSRLYASLHKTKRSYIRSFVFLLTALGDNLKFPKSVARNLGVEVARAITSEKQVEPLCAALRACQSDADQARILSEFVDAAKRTPGSVQKKQTPKQKFEFFVGKTKVTARDGEVRLVSERDFANTPKHVLEEAVAAFEAALVASPRVR